MNGLTEPQLAALSYIVECPGTSMLTIPAARHTVDSLVRLDLVRRSDQGRGGRVALVPQFLWPTASALLVTGHVHEYRREIRP